jgi:addiction module HigA family antidote
MAADEQEFVPAIHPGEFVWEDVLVPLKLDVPTAAEKMGLSVEYLQRLVEQRESVDQNAAEALGALAGNGPSLWLGIQSLYDRWQESQRALARALQGTIIEMRSSTLQPGTVATFEERFAEALPVRTKLSPLAGFWHTEVGPLNRVIQVWSYESFEHQTRVRTAAAKLVGWPPNTREFVVEQQRDILVPTPFSPLLEPRQLGNLYEIRIYTLKPGGIPATIERWSAHIAQRTKLSPLVGAWYSEIGALHKWVHIWAYKDAGERFRVREEARSKGIWPPPGANSGIIIKQENMLVVPASFSPLH